MEQQEETTEQIHRKRRQISSSSKATLSIPLDVASQILSKLPAKSLMRFRCVSKLWSSITSDPYFIETRFIKERPSLLLSIRRRDKLFVFSLPQNHQNSNEPDSISSHPVDSYDVTCPKQYSFFPTVSVHGLIYGFPQASEPIIWNPTTRKFLTLTKPEESWTCTVTFFLGYDPIEGKHKVLSMPSDNTIDECRVLTLGSAQESWRRVKTNHNHQPKPSSPECINGVLYYTAYTDMFRLVIMSFDVRSEKFHMINLPSKLSNGIGPLIPYDGRLACLNGEGCTTLWILRDAEKHDWSPKNFPAPFSYVYPSEKRDFRFVGITDAGEFVYVPYGIYNSFYVLYYDPEKRRFHKVQFKGIADDEFRLKNGLGKRRLDDFLIVLNHKESLMSL